MVKTMKKSVHNRAVDGVKESGYLVLWLKSGIVELEDASVWFGRAKWSGSFLVQVLVAACLQEFRA